MAEFEVGQQVCIAGRGADALAHRHGTVEKITKTQVVVAAKVRGGILVQRYRRGAINNSIPYSPYGGTAIHATCQKEK